MRNFGSSSIGLDGLGRIKSNDLAGSTYQERVFGDFTCSGCLDGVPGSRHSGDERYLCSNLCAESFYCASKVLAPLHNVHLDDDYLLFPSRVCARVPKVQRHVCRGGDSIFSSAKVQCRLDAAMVIEWRGLARHHIAGRSVSFCPPVRHSRG